MNNKQFSRWALLVAAICFFYSCSKNDDIILPEPVQPTAKYKDGFFVITEGSYAKTSGTIQFYAYGADTVVTKVYEKENPGLITSNAAQTSTLQFATLFNNSLYLISELNGPVIKLNAETLQEEARYNQETSNWRSLIGVTENEGLISANDGVYTVNLNTLVPQSKLSTISATNTGDMLKDSNYIFILQSNGAKIISTKNYSFVKSFSNINRGFAKTPNGKVWASTGKRLIGIDKNLDTTGVALTASISSWGLDAPTLITASTKENAVFYTSGKNIYKYVDGNPASVEAPFITIDVSPFMIYGAARYDANKDYIVVNGIAGYGAAAGINYLLIYNASTGALVKKIQYGNDGTVVDFDHIYFPTLVVFH